MSVRRYARDPYWLTARYATTCAKCGARISPGARAFYYPSTKGLYCSPNGCGDAAAEDFEQWAALEERSSW